MKGKAARRQGKPCKTCGGTERYLCSSCVVCAARKVKERKARNTGVEKIYWRRYANKHAETLKEYEKQRYVRDKVKRNARRRAWYLANRDRQHAYTAARKRRLRQATPDWLTEEQLLEIISIYNQARIVSRETGVPHHVDHIIPINGKLVSGLHVPWNLQILTASANISKSNRVPDA